ncbi:hypothetical protein E4T43_02993 [Aureobasidium subglaciale]|nr:hypothetical protein E4T43_02993 [Aureobasidium subglaciale]
MDHHRQSCGEDLPTYESLYGTHSDALAPQLEDDNTPFNEMAALEDSDNDLRLSDMPWISSGWNKVFYWHRAIEQSGTTLYQYGISINENFHTTSGPDHYFTCRMMPRPGFSRRRIVKVCEQTAQALKLHRGPTGANCNCCIFQKTRGSQTGCVYGSISTSRTQFRQSMDRHDLCCFCDCFGVNASVPPIIPTTPAAIDSVTTNEVLPLEKRNIDQAWDFADTNPSHPTIYTRTIKSGDQIWHQYGFNQPSRAGLTDTQEVFFTCKTTPRGGKNEQAIHQHCGLLVDTLRMHRLRKYRGCNCTFKNLREENSKCNARRYHLFARSAHADVLTLRRMRESIHQANG